jgi:hypothetical protein
MLKKAPFLSVFVSFLLFSQEFSNGVHLKNLDNRQYTIKYTEFVMSTRICNCKYPVPSIKNGLGSAYLRKNVKGFTVISKNNTQINNEIEIIGVIDPKTTILCLSANLLSIEVFEIGKLQNISNKTIVISDGKIKITSTK